MSGAKIAWNTPGDYTRCVANLNRYVSDRIAKGLCAELHKQMTGSWPGEQKD